MLLRARRAPLLLRNAQPEEAARGSMH
ncbi:hypothetical protein A2U01_0118661, partial [Trifolium medium]|nr:hypothetical protein [Trifolium medium]